MSPGIPRRHHAQRLRPAAARLGHGDTRNIGNVSQYDFDDAGESARLHRGCGGQSGQRRLPLNMATGATRALDGAPAEYAGLAWRDHATDLAVLRGDKPEGQEAEGERAARLDRAVAAQPAADRRAIRPRPRSSRRDSCSASSRRRAGATTARGCSSASRSRRTRPPKIDRAAGQRRRLALQGRRTAVGADRAVQPVAPRHVRRRCSCRREVRAAGRQRDGHRARWPTDGRGAWAAIRRRTSRVRGGRQPSRADYYRVNTATGAHTLIAKLCADDGHVARQQVVPVSAERARHGVRASGTARR